MTTVIRGADLRPVPWRNGQGTTRDVVTRLGPDGALLWQVSIAELERDAVFSDFTHCDRIFTPVRGDPVGLSFDGEAFTPCPLLVPVAFAGERRTRCRVPGRPAQALNVIADRRAHAATLDVLRLPAGTRVQSAGSAECVLHCVSGAIDAGGPLAPGDSIVGPLGGTWTVLAPSVVLRALISQTKIRARVAP